ncbi:putative 149 kDa protein [Labeo rohita]|uniref:149 kDa protein n=1 Tax=Labeo rohita TaxID=84645 RepID=A0ABQ8L7S6_LABRO|nr:putative 149 kDa protein [Labeo rohita]
MDELYAALQSMQSKKAPGLDGLPVDFYTFFWSVIGEDLLSVLNNSLLNKRLPLSCRRAVLTLLPKKGDLQLIKNWRPVSLRCTDYKLLSKVLASRLTKEMDQIIGPDQTYCVPGRLISDNIVLIRDLLEVAKLFDLNIGLVSIDQEKAFDRVEQKYLWETMVAFGFTSGFINKIKRLYCNVQSVLKINGVLSAPFQVQQGIRQGCPLSGMLYSLAFEPLVQKLRSVLQGVILPGSNIPLKLSAYADDLVVIVDNQKDTDMLMDIIDQYCMISAARVNWSKSEALSLGVTGNERREASGSIRELLLKGRDNDMVVQAG